MTKKTYILSVILLGISLHYISYEFLPKLTVAILSNLINLIFGYYPVYTDNTLLLSIKNVITPINISPECSGISLIIISVILVFLLPNIKFKDRLKSIFLIPIIYILNIFRLMLSLIVGIYFNNAYLILLIHDTIGQLIIIIMVITVLICYLEYIHYFDKKEA